MLTFCDSSLSKFDPFLNYRIPFHFKRAFEVCTGHFEARASARTTASSTHSPLWCVIKLFTSNLKARLASKRVNVRPWETKHGWIYLIRHNVTELNSTRTHANSKAGMKTAWYRNLLCEFIFCQIKPFQKHTLLLKCLRLVRMLSSHFFM